jgi:hypothetical protein
MALLVLVLPMNGGRSNTPPERGGTSSSGALTNPDACGLALFFLPNGSRNLEDELGMARVDDDGIGERVSER